MTTGKAAERLEPLFGIVRKVILALAIVAGAAILVMTGVTVVDILMRLFKSGIVGAYDVVRICGVIAIACALPYLTAVKGHIAIEYFYQRFSRVGRVVLDSVFRVVALALFAFLVYRNIHYGLALRAAGTLMPTLKFPVFWLPLVISFNSLLMCIVIAYHLVHPGEEMIKP